jgi:hypothetical protein
MLERRAHPRHAVQIPAMVLGVADPHNARSATIIDMSKEGAQLRLDRQATMPRRVWVLELEHHNVYDCEVRWSEGTQIGVQILDLVDRHHRRNVIQAVA